MKELKNNDNNMFEDLGNTVRDYIDMRIDEIKLSLTENLSMIFNNLIFIFIITLILALILIFLGLALSTWMEEITNSAIIGNIITAGLFIILGIIVSIFRKNLFTNTFVKLFTKLFFDTKKVKHD